MHTPQARQPPGGRPGPGFFALVRRTARPPLPLDVGGPPAGPAGRLSACVQGLRLRRGRLEVAIERGDERRTLLLGPCGEIVAERR